MRRADERTREPKAGLAAVTAALLLAVCCAGHALVLGALGGLALGSVLGVAAGVLAALGLVAAVIVLRRRRTAARHLAAARRDPS